MAVCCRVVGIVEKSYVLLQKKDSNVQGEPKRNAPQNSWLSRVRD